jgi:hypothetical protein
MARGSRLGRRPRRSCRSSARARPSWQLQNAGTRRPGAGSGPSGPGQRVCPSPRPGYGVHFRSGAGAGQQEASITSEPSSSCASRDSSVRVQTRTRTSSLPTKPFGDRPLGRHQGQAVLVTGPVNEPQRRASPLSRTQARCHDRPAPRPRRACRADRPAGALHHLAEGTMTGSGRRWAGWRPKRGCRRGEQRRSTPYVPQSLPLKVGTCCPVPSSIPTLCPRTSFHDRRPGLRRLDARWTRAPDPVRWRNSSQTWGYLGRDLTEARSRRGMGTRWISPRPPDGSWPRSMRTSTALCPNW